MFSSRSALVKHLISAEHRRLTVICPWCAGKDRTFTKVSDLEVHVRKAHTELTPNKDYFSRPSGFYFAVHPEDYAKVVGTVTSYDSDTAFEMRKAVRTWAEGFSDRKDRITKWNDGWKAGTQIVVERSRSKERRDNNSRRAVERRGEVTCRTNIQIAGNGERSRTDSKGRRGQKDGEQGDVRSSDEGWTGDTYVDRRVVERRDTSLKRKQSESDIGTVRGSKHSRVSTERTLNELDTYEDNIELGDPEEETRSVRKEGRKGEKTGVETGTGGRSQDAHCDNDREIDSCQEQGGRGKKEKRRMIEFEEMSDGEEAASTITSSSSSSSSSSEGSTVTKEGTESDADGFRTRAIQLLKKGAMPVCPPAKRDWTSFGNTIEMDFDGQVLSWPPTNWRKLNPDQRLMAHEYAAMFIEQRTTKNIFPQISRRTLIDKYAFLSLDGEGKPQDEEEEMDKVEAKIRQYNFTYLKGIAKGEIPSSRVAMSILKTIENSSRWMDTDVFTTKLDDGGVKIRL